MQPPNTCTFPSFSSTTKSSSSPPPHKLSIPSFSLCISFPPPIALMDAAHWPQGVGVEPSRNSSESSKKPRAAEKGQALNCPRCKSTNTKFCYYNNYSLSQPRYFCKNCRRYWTAGGTLRNVPVGGSSRKKKRSSSLAAASSSSFPSSISTQKSIRDLNPPKLSPQNPKIHDGEDLKLSYNNLPLYNGISELVALPFMLQSHYNLTPENPNSDLFPVCNSNSVMSSSGFPMHGLKGLPVENRFGNSQPPVQDGPISLPFEESRTVANYELEHHHRGLQRDHSNGFWSGGS